MRTTILTALCLLATTPVLADEPVYFTDGSTAWRGANGQLWGKTPAPGNHAEATSPAPPPPRAPLIDTQGSVYPSAGPNGVIDPRTGQFIPTR